MRHKSDLQWNRLPLVFNFGKGMIIHNLSLDDVFQIKKKIRERKESLAWEKSNMRDLYDLDMGKVEFYDLLEAHGCDELGTSESERSDVAWIVKDLNRLSKKNALLNRAAEYREYKPDNIYRCGQWYFTTWSQEKYVNIDYEKEKVEKRGGKRDGSGRKSKTSKLLQFDDKQTTTIRVPSSFKEPIKKLIDFLIEQEEIGLSVNSVLHDAEWKFEEEANKWRSELETVTPQFRDSWDKYAAQAEAKLDVVKRMREILPFIRLEKEK